MTSRSDGKFGRLVVGAMTAMVLLCGAFGVAWLLWHAFLALSPHVNSTVITALSTAIGSAVTLILTKRWDRRWELEQQHRAQKIPIYEEFMRFLFRLFLGAKSHTKPVTEVEMADFIVGFMQKLIVWGSDDVLREYGAFRKTSQTAGDGWHLAVALERLLFAIRLDLGHRNRGLKQGALLTLFINDLPPSISTKVDQP